MWFCILWSHIGHIPDLLAQVLLPLLTSGEMEGISGGAAGGDGCKEVGWSFPSSTWFSWAKSWTSPPSVANWRAGGERGREAEKSLRRTKYHAWDVCRVAAKLTHFIKWVWQNEWLGQPEEISCFRYPDRPTFFQKRQKKGGGAWFSDG